jgi:hypothetical protein
MQMLFAIAVLLIHPQIAPHRSFSAEKVALQPSSSEISGTNNEISLPLAPSVTASAATTGTSPETTATDAGVQPIAEAIVIEFPDAPASAIEPSATPALILVRPSTRNTVSVSELAAENRRNQRIWKGLAIASSGAATFDAWTTRHSIATQGAQELNPLLKPFAGNASLYAAIQVGPVLMDFAARKMMYSRNSWVRHLWWAPQTASFISSMFCGAHNLSYHQ